MEIRTDLSDGSMKLSISPGDLTGKAPSDVLAGLRFLGAFHAPHSLRFGAEFGPLADTPMPIPEAHDPGGWDTSGALVFAEALATIQQHTTEQLAMPPPEASEQEVGLVVRAARLLRGETVTAHWTRWRLEIPEQHFESLQSSPQYTLAVDAPLVVTVAGKNIDLGWHRRHVLTARLDPDEPPQPHGGKVRITLVPGDLDEAKLCWFPIHEADS